MEHTLRFFVNKYSLFCIRYFNTFFTRFLCTFFLLECIHVSLNISVQLCIFFLTSMLSSIWSCSLCWSASPTKFISFSIPFSASICSNIFLISASVNLFFDIFVDEHSVISVRQHRARTHTTYLVTERWYTAAGKCLTEGPQASGQPFVRLYVWQFINISSMAINACNRNLIAYIFISTWHHINIIDLN